MISARAFTLGLTAVVGSGLVLGGATIAREPLGNDEIASLALVSRPVGAFASDFVSSQSAGMLFHAVLWPIVALGGVSSFWLRLPSLLAFAGAIAVCGLVGARLGGRAVGLCAALFLSVCPFAILHAQDARMYSFALLFSLLAFWALLRSLETPTGARWATYAATVAATGYSHEFALLTVVAHVPLVLADTRATTRKQFALALVGSAAILVPLGAVSLHNRGLDPLYYVTAPGVAAIEDTVLVIVGSRPAVAACALVIASGIVAALRMRRAFTASERRRGSAIAVSLALWLVGPFALLFAASQIDPIFSPRYVISSAAAACLGIALLLAFLPRRLGVAGVFVIALAFGYGTIQQSRSLDRADWPGAATWLRSTAGAGPIVLVGGQRNAAALLYYSPGLGVPRTELPWTEAELARLPPKLTLIDRDNSVSDLRAAVSRTPAWVVEQGRVAPGLQRAFDAFLDSCQTAAEAELRLISIRRVVRCPHAG
ncbi:MAG: glycosyltransferase family 39 protein [Gaiella sp.]|nr:glycosyltransferase family 39 protein [Gaiella sp.]